MTVAFNQLCHIHDGEFGESITHPNITVSSGKSCVCIERSVRFNAVAVTEQLNLEDTHAANRRTAADTMRRAAIGRW